MQEICRFMAMTPEGETAIVTVDLARDPSEHLRGFVVTAVVRCDEYRSQLMSHRLDADDFMGLHNEKEIQFVRQGASAILSYGHRRSRKILLRRCSYEDEIRELYELARPGKPIGTVYLVREGDQLIFRAENEGLKIYLMALLRITYAGLEGWRGRYLDVEELFSKEKEDLLTPLMRLFRGRDRFPYILMSPISRGDEVCSISIYKMSRSQIYRDSDTLPPDLYKSTTRMARLGPIVQDLEVDGSRIRIVWE